MPLGQLVERKQLSTRCIPVCRPHRTLWQLCPRSCMMEKSDKIHVRHCTPSQADLLLTCMITWRLKLGVA